jgi:phospholipase C
MKRISRNPYLFGLTLLAVGVGVALAVTLGAFSFDGAGSAAAVTVNNSAKTTTPIKHLVVIFDENQSFDHLFGTYPYAENTDGTDFCPQAGTAGLPGSSESVNTELGAGLVPDSTLGAPIEKGGCATYQGVTPNPEAGANPPVADPTAPNPNEYQPQRIPDTAAVTCDNNHSYTPEEEAVDGGKMDHFVQYTSADCAIPGASNSSPGIGMDYYDGNTATGLWNYAQHYGLADNSWDATFGPTMIGSLNMFSGTTYSSITGSTYISNTDPVWDDIDGESGEMGGGNIGTVMNEKGISWGWFEEGFQTPTASDSNVDGHSAAMFGSIYDAPDWWQATSNEDHVKSATNTEIGFNGPANHMYDTPEFFESLEGKNGAAMPAVSFLRSDVVRTGHPSSSDPLDEQEWIEGDVNAIEKSAYWPSTAIVIEYDDSDGYYDHQPPTILNSSDTGSDSAICTEAHAAGVPEIGNQSNRCGPSQRLPFEVISPYVKPDHVDHSLITQDSTLKFIEKNWGLPTVGPATFDNLPQLSDLESFFDWSQPQQKEVLLDNTCDVPGKTVILNTCNNTTANAVAGDGIEDDGTTTDAGFGAVQSTPAVTVAAPPTESVATDTVTVPAAPTGTLSEGTLLSDVGATINQGTLTADTSEVNLQVPGTYRATVSGTYRYASSGTGGFTVENEIESVEPQSVSVDVVPTVSVAHSTLTYEASKPPLAEDILKDAGASINSGTLAEPDLSGIDLSSPGNYTVSIGGSSAGEQATPVTVQVTVIPPPAITLTNSTVHYLAGESPPPAQVLADAGATINAGALEAPDLSGVDFGKAGSYTVKVEGSAVGSEERFEAPARTLTVVVEPGAGNEGPGNEGAGTVTPAPRISVAKAAVAYLVGANPSSAQVLSDAGATTSAGSLAVDLSAVNFAKAGVYQVTVTGSDEGVAAQPVPLAIDVLAQPAVSLGSAEISTMQGSSLSSDQVLTDAGASLPGGTLAPVDLSGVDFGKAGSYTAKVAGSVDGLAATPATVKIDVVAPPVLSIAHPEVTYPSGARVSAAELLMAAGATVSGGSAEVDLSGVDFSRAGRYSVQVTGGADGVAATPATVEITVKPVISLKHPRIKLQAGPKATGKAALAAAGAKITSGTLTLPSLAPILTKPGAHKEKVSGKSNGIAATPVTLTIVITPPADHEAKPKRAR